MNKKYLSLEEVQNIFSTRNQEYEKASGFVKIQDAINKSLFKIIEFIQEEKIKVYQIDKNGGTHTFIELSEGKLNNDEEEELYKIAKFLKKIETTLGYDFIN